MIDKEKVIAGLTMLADRKNDDTCEGLKCCKIAKDAITLLKTQPQIIECKDQKRDYEWASVYESKINICVCGHEINRYWHPKYCGFCGMRLEWC